RDIANNVAQYGPPGADEPDAWMLAHKDGTGGVALSPVAPSKDAREAYDRGAALLRAGQSAEATSAFRVAVDESPRVPALRLALARSLERSAPTEAEQVYRNLLALDPTLASAHVGLSGVLVA